MDRVRKSAPIPGGLIVRRLDDDSGEMIGGLNAATWGRLVDFTLVAERGGTAVHARWKPRFPLQFITWGQENRDLTLFQRLLTSSVLS